jgi:alkylmercury lyase
MTENQHTTTGPDVDLGQLIAEYAETVPPMDKTEASVAIRLWRLLAQGAPVTIQALAGDLGVPARQVEAALDGALAGSYAQDDQGGIIAFWGLSLPGQPSQHRLRVGGQTLYAWCAPDTLGLPRVIGATATVQSVIETTGQPITLVVRPDGVQNISVDGAVVSLVRAPGKSVGDNPAAIMSTFCHHQLFFPSRQAGDRWARAQGRDDIVILTLEEAIRVWDAAIRPPELTLGE